MPQTNSSDNDGLYQGDVQYDTLRNHLNTSGILRDWQTICENKLGWPHGRIKTEPIRRLDPFWRLFDCVLHAQIEFLADFDTAVQVDDGAEAFLRRLFQAAQRRGREIFSVPEDVLVFLVLRRRDAFLTQSFVRNELGFDDRIAEAIIEVLEVPE